ncbi:MAG: nitroreductase family protein [Eubacteriales bacterium]
MDFLDIINKRQSIRKYQEGDIPNEDLKAIIEIAGKAPSGKNVQNWHFIAIKRRDLIQKLADLITAKNEDIAKKMEQKDNALADRFRKFCKNFTVFWRDSAPAIIITLSKDYIPSGFNEYKLIDAENPILEDLLRFRNPGMQNVGAACENLTLAAIDKGYGTCWLTSANYVAKEIEEFLKNEIGFDLQDYYFVNMFSIGIPMPDQKSPTKKAVDEILTLID